MRRAWRYRGELDRDCDDTAPAVLGVLPLARGAEVIAVDSHDYRTALFNMILYI